eukprot:CAMPEP_0180323888 /NCGR_PEP_ID=MMETSP0988-20121125/37549_1 /TAXON_ID=697907 /ORGANISM="non described non described, Strain CCMP2293" /LENGTH=78 /DNA_ID=CAMNT_0022310117 /DNA_START=396 /DNA_END=628 /DNA_ORIENTATION=-
MLCGGEFSRYVKTPPGVGCGRRFSPVAEKGLGDMGFGFQRTNQLKPGDLCSAEDAGPPALVESSQLDSLTVPAKPADS